MDIQNRMSFFNLRRHLTLFRLVALARFSGKKAWKKKPEYTSHIPFTFASTGIVRPDPTWTQANPLIYTTKQKRHLRSSGRFMWRISRWSEFLHGIYHGPTHLGGMAGKWKNSARSNGKRASSTGQSSTQQLNTLKSVTNVMDQLKDC